MFCSMFYYLMLILHVLMACWSNLFCTHNVVFSVQKTFGTRVIWYNVAQSVVKYHFLAIWRGQFPKFPTWHQPWWHITVSLVWTSQGLATLNYLSKSWVGDLSTWWQQFQGLLSNLMALFSLFLCNSDKQ